jgi:hypothetical protein
MAKREASGVIYRRQKEFSMSEVLFLVEEAPEGGYLARALSHSIYTEADTWEELKAALHDAVNCHFEEDQKSRIIRINS